MILLEDSMDSSFSVIISQTAWDQRKPESSSHESSYLSMFSTSVMLFLKIISVLDLTLIDSPYYMLKIVPV